MHAAGLLGLVNVREWLGGNLDHPLMSWDDWNRWQLPLIKAKEKYEAPLKFARRTGTYESGSDFLWQFIGRWRK